MITKILTALFLFSSLASAQPSGSTLACQSLLRTPSQNAQTIVDTLARALPGRTIHKKNPADMISKSVRHPSETQYQIKRVMDGVTIGELEYTIRHTSPHVMHIEWARTHPKYRKHADQKSRGVFKFLLAEAILFHPKIKEISGNLDETNAEVFLRKQDETFETNRTRSASKLTSKEIDRIAIRHTPAYKARHALGFTEIREFLPGTTIYLRMGIPTNQ